MTHKIKISLILTTFFISALAVATFGLPYEAVEATASRWLEQAYPDTATISGLVDFKEIEINTPDPLPDVEVVLFRMGEGEFEVVSMVKTDHAGRYQFLELAQGEYYLGYYGATPVGNYVVQFHNGKTDLSGADPIAVSTSSSQVVIPPVTFLGPAEPVLEVLGNGGGSIFVDPQTGQIFINKPKGNVTFGIDNRCAPGSYTSLDLIYGGISSYQMVENTLTNIYMGFIPKADMILPSAEITVDYNCTSRAESDVDAIEVVGRITQFDPMGEIRSAINGEGYAGANIKLYRMDGATPDSGTTQDGDCRTVNSRPTTGSWSGVPSATVDPLEFVVSADLAGSGAADPPINPYQTDEDGFFGWDLADGCWYIEVTAPGHDTLVSPVFGARSGAEITDLNFVLNPQNIMYTPLISRAVTETIR